MNSVQLVGNLTKDPIMSEGGVAMFTLAVNRHDKEKNADFPSIKVFGKQAENVCKYLHKGSMCGIEGRIETGSYKNKDGETIYYTDVIANRIEFIGGGKKQAETSEKQGSNVSENERDSEPENLDEDFVELDEDVPF